MTSRSRGHPGRTRRAWAPWFQRLVAERRSRWLVLKQARETAYFRPPFLLADHRDQIAIPEWILDNAQWRYTQWLALHDNDWSMRATALNQAVLKAVDDGWRSARSPSA